MNNCNTCGAGRARGSIHPLQIEHVAKKIFTLLEWGSADVLSCRLVCKNWCDIITNIQKRKRLARKFHFKYEDTKLLEQFLQDMQRTSNLPFDVFEFETHFFIPRHEKLFGNFLKICSPFITSLKLSFGKHFGFVNTPGFTDINFCSLKTLSFRSDHLETMSDSSEWKQRHPRIQSKALFVLLNNILNSAKELRTLEFHLPAKYFCGDHAKLVNEEFGKLVTEKLPDSVTSLNLLMELHGKELMDLIRLNLRKLHLTIYGPELDEDSLRDFFRHQQSSLVDVMFVDLQNRHSLDGLISSTFSKVKYLEIKGIEDGCFSYLEHFPCLQKLALLTGSGFQQTSNASCKAHPPERKCSYRTVTELELKFPIQSPNLMHKILIYLPNIKILRIQATQESGGVIETIFQLMAGLEEFQLTFPRAFTKQQVDPIFTGLSLARCLGINQNEIYNRELQRRLLNDVRRKPSLDNLSRLQKLAIHAEESAIILTDVTIYCAILRLPSLTSLELSGDFNISAKGMDSLVALRVFGLEQYNHRLSRSTQQAHHENGSDCMALVPI